MARIAFGAAYLAVQVALILTAGRRPEAAFGFRMFPESSTLQVHLARRVEASTGQGTALVGVEDGTWTAKDAAGVKHIFRWGDRVKEQELNAFDFMHHASYGLRTQLTRFAAALDYVASHVSEDAETRALVLEITYQKNGREPAHTVFESALPAYRSARAEAPPVDDAW
jgi:hypothetical protein